MYDYKLEDDEWVELEYIDCDKTWRGAQGCAIQDFVLICGGRGLRRRVQLLQLNITNNHGHTNDVVTHKMRQTSNLLLLQNEKQQTSIQTLPSQLPVCVDYGHTVTFVENKKVLVVGGFVNGNASNRVIQGEVARLQPHFKVSLDPAQPDQNFSETYTICQLEDRDLPSVPPLNITIPRNYPESASPICSELVDYDLTPFLKKVKDALMARMAKLPQRHSLSQLLSAWEMSVRAACSLRQLPVSKARKHSI